VGKQKESLGVRTSLTWGLVRESITCWERTSRICKELSVQKVGDIQSPFEAGVVSVERVLRFDVFEGQNGPLHRDTHNLARQSK